MSDLESKIEELMEDCDTKELLDTLDGDLTRLEEDSLLNDRLDGVGTSDSVVRYERIEGTADNEGYGDALSPDVITVGVSGSVLSLSKEEKDPLGLRKEVSKEVSGPS